MHSNQIYPAMQEALFEPEPVRKRERVKALYALFVRGGYDTDTTVPPKPLEQPSYAGVLNVVAPAKLPRRLSPQSPEGRGQMVHAIAHIEYSAIDLALDAAYRFRDMPEAFTADWLKVAHDEVRHFEMLHALMEELGISYGDWPVHAGLFDACARTQYDLLERLAVVPRYLEASGLDATPRILRRFASLKDPFAKKFKAVLNAILEDEVDHVRRGDKWFKQVCRQKGVREDVYVTIIRRYFPEGLKHGGSVNVEARKAAGFSCAELLELGAKTCRDKEKNL